MWSLANMWTLSTRHDRQTGHEHLGLSPARSESFGFAFNLSDRTVARGPHRKDASLSRSLLRSSGPGTRLLLGGHVGVVVAPVRGALRAAETLSEAASATSAWSLRWARGPFRPISDCSARNRGPQ